MEPKVSQAEPSTEFLGYLEELIEAYSLCPDKLQEHILYGADIDEIAQHARECDECLKEWLLRIQFNELCRKLSH